MREVFADACYWIALLIETDELHESAVQASNNLNNALVITTDSVFLEVFNFVSKRGETLRQAAVSIHRELLNDNNVSIIPQSRTHFNSAVLLFEKRKDKNYSLTDCYSMIEMRSRKINEILTNDHHFAQEGFQILLKLDREK